MSYCGRFGLQLLVWDPARRVSSGEARPRVLCAWRESRRSLRQLRPRRRNAVFRMRRRFSARRLPDKRRPSALSDAARYRRGAAGARYHRVFDYSWKFPGEVKVATTRTSTGYLVEGCISLSALESLGMPSLRHGNAMRIGIFRADYRHEAKGGVQEHWLSWVAPAVPTPDFHVASAFGIIK